MSTTPRGIVVDSLVVHGQPQTCHPVMVVAGRFDATSAGTTGSNSNSSNNNSTDFIRASSSLSRDECDCYDDEHVSSTQDESDVSSSDSYVWKPRQPIEVPVVPVVVVAVVPPTTTRFDTAPQMCHSCTIPTRDTGTVVSESSKSDNPNTKEVSFDSSSSASSSSSSTASLDGHHDGNHTTTTSTAHYHDANLHTATTIMTTVPFLSLNVQYGGRNQTNHDNEDNSTVINDHDHYEPSAMESIGNNDTIATRVTVVKEPMSGATTRSSVSSRDVLDTRAGATNPTTSFQCRSNIQTDAPTPTATTNPSVWIQHVYMDMLPTAWQVGPTTGAHPRAHGTAESPTDDHGTDDHFGGAPFIAVDSPVSPKAYTTTNDNDSRVPSLHKQQQRTLSSGRYGVPWHIYIPTVVPSSVPTEQMTHSSPYNYCNDNDATVLQDGVDQRCDELRVSNSTWSVATEHVTLQTELLDPTEPLFYTTTNDTTAMLHNENEEKLHDSSPRLSPELKHCADILYHLLGRHWHHPTCASTIRDLVECMNAYPETCQVRYPPMVVIAPTTTTTTMSMCGDSAGGPPQGVGSVYPLSYFCVTACLPAIRAAYTAFPEAIGCADACLGLPLHYACHHAPLETLAQQTSSRAVIQFLLVTFPDAVRRTNDVHQTPLHLACARDRLCPEIVSLLVAAYPAAALTFDDQGYTPLLSVCRRRHDSGIPGNDETVVNPNDRDVVVQIMRMLCATSPLTVSAVTGCTMEKALHLAAFVGASDSVIEFLLYHDPSQCRYTDDAFQLPIHKAVYAACYAMTISHHHANESITQQLLGTVSRLAYAYPEGIHSTDANDERPLDIASRLLLEHSNDASCALQDPNQSLRQTLLHILNS